MIRIAIKLTDNGVGSYFDEAEFWTRNQLAESQIGSTSGVAGMFWSDATHPFSIPTNNKNFRYNVDGSANAIIAMHDVWEHIVTVKGTTAHVNFLLNRASPYITVRSDLPYRGQVEAQTAPSIGNLTSLAVRIPDWADHAYASVSVTKRGADGTETTVAAGTEAGWVFSGSYAYIYNIKPNTTYTVHFPIKVYTASVYQMRSPDTFWYEGSYPSSAGPESITIYTGTFRGYELVSATPAPNYSGVALYQRQHLAALAASDVAPPTKEVTRFIHNGTSSSIPAVLPIPTLPVTPSTPPTPTPTPTTKPDILNNGDPYQGPAPLTVTFSGVVNGNASCSASTYTLSYGGTQAEELTVPAGLCAPKLFSITHLYTTPGFYNAGLFKGTILQVQTQSGYSTINMTPINVTSVSASTNDRLSNLANAFTALRAAIERLQTFLR